MRIEIRPTRSEDDGTATLTAYPIGGSPAEVDATVREAARAFREALESGAWPSVGASLVLPDGGELPVAAELLAYLELPPTDSGAASASPSAIDRLRAAAEARKLSTGIALAAAVIRDHASAADRLVRDGSPAGEAAVAARAAAGAAERMHDLVTRLGRFAAVARPVRQLALEGVGAARAAGNAVVDRLDTNDENDSLAGPLRAALTDLAVAQATVLLALKPSGSCPPRGGLPDFTSAAALAAITDSDVTAAAIAAIGDRVSAGLAADAREQVARSLNRLLELARALPERELVAAVMAGQVRGELFDPADPKLEAAEDNLLCAVLRPDAGLTFMSPDVEDHVWGLFDELRYDILSDAARRLFAPVVAAAQD